MATGGHLDDARAHAGVAYALGQFLDVHRSVGEQTCRKCLLQIDPEDPDSAVR